MNFVYVDIRCRQHNPKNHVAEKTLGSPTLKTPQFKSENRSQKTTDLFTFLREDLFSYIKQDSLLKPLDKIELNQVLPCIVFFLMIGKLIWLPALEVLYTNTFFAWHISKDLEVEEMNL